MERPKTELHKRNGHIILPAMVTVIVTTTLKVKPERNAGGAPLLFLQVMLIRAKKLLFLVTC